MTSDLLPKEYWGLDPVFTSYVKLFVKDVHQLELYTKECTQIYRYKNHPLYKVDLQGVVVRLVEKEKFFICDIDDGSGVIRVCCWKPKNGCCEEMVIFSDKKYSNLTAMITQVATRNEPDLGLLLHVRGNIKIYREMKEISANYYMIHDPMAEVSYTCHRVHLYKTVYDLPFKLPYKLRTEIMDKKLFSETGIKSERNLVCELKEKIMEYAEKHQIPMLTLQDLLTTDELVAEARQNTSNPETADQGYRFSLKNIFEKAVKLLFEEGLIVTSSEHTICKKYHFVGIGKLLEKAVMEILYIDSKSDKFDGSHVLRIVDQITSKSGLLVNKASVSKTLKILELNSKIISVSDLHYQIIK